MSEFTYGYNISQNNKKADLEFKLAAYAAEYGLEAINELVESARQSVSHGQAHDVVMSYQFARNYVDEHGWEEFLCYLQTNWPERDLFKVSNDWYENIKYSCKAKGTKGDLVIKMK